MLDLFVELIESNKQKLTEKNVRISAHKEKRHETLSFFTTAIAEFETDKIVGNIILYVSGECEIHVFSNNEKKDEIFIEVHEPESENDLFNLLKSVFDRITSF